MNFICNWFYYTNIFLAEVTFSDCFVNFVDNVQSPDGCTVASAAGDETLRFWNVFGTPEVAKPAPKANPEPFAHVSRIR